MIKVVFPDIDKLPETIRLPNIVPPFAENLVFAKSYAKLAVRNAPFACVRAVFA